MEDAFRLQICPKGIATLIFDLPGKKVNTLSETTLEELKEHLDALHANVAVKLLIIKSGKTNHFVAGADLHRFATLFDKQESAEELIDLGHTVFDQIANFRTPTVALIHGGCLGGGLELALACTYRVVTDHPNTKLGLPEVKLGIFPGWGGTQRLPRLVGWVRGVEMVVSGRVISALRAFQIGLADAIFPWEFTDTSLSSWVSSLREGKKLKRKKPSGAYRLLEGNFVGRALIAHWMKKKILKKTKGHYPAPFAALQLMRQSFGKNLRKGLLAEKKAFVSSMKKKTFSCAPYLIRLFLNRETVQRDPGLKSVPVPARSVYRAGVVGAGTMGCGIASLFARHEMSVRIKEVNGSRVESAYRKIWEEFQTLVKKKKMTPREANFQFLQIGACTDWTGFGHLELVVEAAVEDIEVKQKILYELEENVSSSCILATNTSSLTLKQLITGMVHPERLVGMHFFNPPGKMPLVEVVCTEGTDPAVVSSVVEVCKSCQKTPVVVRDCPGFLVNRIFGIAFIEVLHLLEEGVAIDTIDRSMTQFGFPMPPLLLADLVGNDVNYRALKNLEKGYGKRMAVPKLLQLMDTNRWYGKKVGCGFYRYAKGCAYPNRELFSEIEEKKTLSEEDILERILCAMLNESARCLEEKVVQTPAHLDLGLVYGIGFPPFRGGILRYADSCGLGKMREKLLLLAQSEGERFTPCELIDRMGSGNRLFYSGKLTGG